jgi:hypothetical protein
VAGSLKAPPSSNKAAYEQAVYWLSLAARRADHASNKDAQNVLYNAAHRLYLSFGQKGSLAVLADALDTVNSSSLDPADKAYIAGVLSNNWWGLATREGIRWTVILGVAGGVTYWIYSRRKS